MKSSYFVLEEFFRNHFLFRVIVDLNFKKFFLAKFFNLTRKLEQMAENCKKQKWSVGHFRTNESKINFVAWNFLDRENSRIDDNSEPEVVSKNYSKKSKKTS